LQKKNLFVRIKQWYTAENPRWVRVCCILAASFLLAGLILSQIFAPPKVNEATLYIGGTFEKTEVIGSTAASSRLAALRRMLAKGEQLIGVVDVAEPDVLLLLDTSNGPMELWVWYDDLGHSGVRDSMLYMYADDPGTFYRITGGVKIRAESAIEQSVE